MGLEPTQTWSFDEVFEADSSDYIFGDLLTKMKSTNQILKNQYTALLLKENETSLRKASYYPTIPMGAGIDFGHNWAMSGGTQNLNMFKALCAAR